MIIKDFFFFVGRLHREALKQSATDPISGKIDINILTTGLSATARRQRHELTDHLKKLIESKGKVSTLNFQKTLSELKEALKNPVSRYSFKIIHLICFYCVLIS